MKLILPTAALLALAACTSRPENAFVINGTIPGAQNGEEVTISYLIGDSTINDTVLIADEKFCFEGTVPAYGTQARLKYGPESKPYQGDNILTMYFEPGETEVTLTQGKVNKGTVTGSMQQKIEQDFNNYYDNYIARHDSLRNAKTAGDIDDASYAEQTDKLFKEFSDNKIKMIKDNNGTYWAYALFSFAADGIPLEVCDSIYAAFPEELKASEEKVKNSLEARHRIQPGMPAPVLSGHDPLRDADISLTQLQGKYVLIDFWATWCGGCVKALPHIREVYDRYHDRGLEVLCMTSDHEMDKWEKYMRDHDMGVFYNIPAGIKAIYDENGEITDIDKTNDQTKLYNINFIPQTYLVDPEGKIVAHLDGAEEIDAKLAEIFK